MSPSQAQNALNLMAHSLCEDFASVHELPVDYVWAEFANPEVNSFEEVADALDMSDPFIYHA